MIFLALLQTTQIAYNAGSHLDALMSRLAVGDKDALAELYHETRAAVYGFSLSITKNPADSEDVLQETYLKIWANAERYTAKGTPMSWILTIAKNLSLMKLREKKRHQDLEPEEWDMSFHIPDTAGNTEDRHLLEAALNILTDEERHIILLHAVSGLKHREIAELLDMALATVLSKYHRALKKLRKYIEGVEAND
ncbi:MAG: RNA polymerase sigma factor [Tyzzerella sp.]|nr:RNA polymerase sigma factor [Tyzzerella sp.]